MQKTRKTWVRVIESDRLEDCRGCARLRAAGRAKQCFECAEESKLAATVIQIEPGEFELKPVARKERRCQGTNCGCVLPEGYYYFCPECHEGKEDEPIFSRTNFNSRAAVHRTGNGGVR
jgi:hypothetical protein